MKIIKQDKYKRIKYGLTANVRTELGIRPLSRICGDVVKSLDTDGIPEKVRQWTVNAGIKPVAKSGNGTRHTSVRMSMLIHENKDRVLGFEDPESE